MPTSQGKPRKRKGKVRARIRAAAEHVAIRSAIRKASDENERVNTCVSQPR
jgi:hypothetical protein